MESTVSATVFTTSPRDKIKPNMTNITQASCGVTEVSAHPAFIFAYSLVFLISLVLNSITMRVYFCSNQRVQSSIMVYMKNLAAADFFLCLCLPLRIAHNATYSITIRHIYCSFGATAFYINMYASILFMDIIAANRYLKIVRPLETHALQTVRIARYISIGTWISLLAMSSIYLILFLQTSWHLDPKFSSGCGRCIFFAITNFSYSTPPSLSATVTETIPVQTSSLDSLVPIDVAKVR
ncbi:P2Y purinoceptor 14-like protein [Labeo rohita]|uniref:P2Y purinoceptor 14-like protein n=1 Tax=Labeo rohita TaxID=84645 RepID=A0A498P4E5_LABRO|nr:P2Y purinoceptor 14-like protein [Labeo rohita]